MKKLNIIHFNCLAATEPWFEVTNDDDEGTVRFECPKCGVIILVSNIFQQIEARSAKATRSLHGEEK